MASLAFLAVLVPLLGIAVVVVFIVAVIQEGKSDRRAGFKQAFFTIVALVMLGVTVGSVIGLMNTTLRNIAFPSAKNYERRFTPPTQLYLPSTSPKIGSDVVKPDGSSNYQALTCTADCQFSADDKRALADWKASYQTWRDETIGNLTFRKDLAVLLPFLIVALPLFIVFFRLMQRGSAAEQAETKKLSPLRSLYFYFIAFTGLLVAVIGAGGLVNLGLNQLLRTTTSSSTSEALKPMTDDSGIQSVIACADRCDIAAADVALARQWITDNEKFSKDVTATRGKTANDLSIFIPLLLVGFPLFWFHFNRIRKETQDHQITPATS